MTPEEEMNQRLSGLFPETLGLEVTSAKADAVEGRLTVTAAICTTGKIMHGGAVMSMADTLGAVGTVLNLREGQGTTTLESKTNFFAAAPEGALVIATCLPLHRGGRTQVWQTTLRLESGKMVAQVTQTQMVLEPRA